MTFILLLNSGMFLHLKYSERKTDQSYDFSFKHLNITRRLTIIYNSIDRVKSKEYVS